MERLRSGLCGWWALAFVCALLCGCFSVRSREGFTYERLEPANYARLLADSADHLLIDVRTSGEFAKGHLPGALNHSYLSFRFGRSVQTLERDTLVFIYCQTCHRSPLAARRMKRMGFRRVVDLKGGFTHWRTSVDPAQELLP
ncbi:MAG: rhodanese-like domain-containing protein [Flavobacteriales bacterium]|nr:rhodanese-like domain-containing protein [Flavobacteriales bacterium]